MINASGMSADSAISPSFVTYPVQTSSSGAIMEPGFDNPASNFMQHDDTTALEKAVPADKLQAMLQTQLECYFSAENLNRDKYLLTQTLS